MNIHADSPRTDETALPVVHLRRPRWGDPATPGELPAAAAALVGADGTERRGVAPDDVVLAEPQLPVDARSALVEALGEHHVIDDHRSRIDHTRGYSTPDILALRSGDGTDAPDVVVTPGSHDDVLRVLEICAEHRVAVVPFTGGTSVVGGLAPDRTGFAGVVTVDLARLDELVDIDEISRTATLQAGLRGVRAEELLRAKGYTLGHFPQSYAGAGIGGYAATRSAGQSSAGYGRFDDMVEGMVLATPRGTIALGAAPKSAAGPDLRHLVLGSEGVLGIITEVTVRVHPVPDHRVFEGWHFDDFDAGAAALRALAQDGPMPTVLRLSDEMETAINLADPDGAGGTDAAGPTGGCLAVIGVEGAHDEVEARHAAVTAVLERAGGVSMGEGPGESWRTGRFRAPYLRDPLLDAGVLVETLETVTYWSRLADLKVLVTAALTDTLTAAGTAPLVMCHISHVYPAGASLYFTVVCPQTDDPIAQWAAAKTAANDAIRAAGASITHHHAVGRDHRATYHAEIGDLALDALRAVKVALDPAGVCNPGILI
ncbi:FAD-binding oxidoreductase [Gordonia insulae]|uniref:Putative FAD-linked oxidoreductase n=1 Tax=Gordonia insulae TaxID=2420509 RepID=A0A3G8JRH5_9ACTN|nr:FAD-binding oxidoreductase [Gordonia insulae]AZG47496.1 putative FAD-linked oxidoreductase [Gordonia insulae]